DNGNGLQTWGTLYPARRLPSIDDGQRQVHQDEVRSLPFGRFDAGRPVDRRENLVPVLQDLDQEVAVELDILDDQDPLHGPASAGGGRCEAASAKRSGSVTVNVDPIPTVLSSSMSPPIRRARWRLIESPNPVPP